jgi:hypothetical protein
MKKGQGISINVIIIAAIALLVLVILAVLVIGAGKKTNEGTQKCELLGGKCAADCGDAEAIAASNCEGQLCCPIFTTAGGTE